MVIHSFVCQCKHPLLAGAAVKKGCLSLTVKRMSASQPQPKQELANLRLSD